MHIAQFVHRYPPARGGAEAYAFRLKEHHRRCGDTVDVWTTTAINLEEFWHKGASPTSIEDNIRRYRPQIFPLRRYVLKAMATLLPPKLRTFCLSCSPISMKMWVDAGRYNGSLDAVHAIAFPYAWPILCARRLARRHGVPFYLTPFLHLGDERTKRQYLQPALDWLLKEADGIFVQTHQEYDAVRECSVPEKKIFLQGLGVEPAECTRGNRQSFRIRHGIDLDEIIVGQLANLSTEKGTVDLLEACQLLWKRGVPFRVALAGPSMPNFRKYWHGFYDKRRVIRLDELSENEKRDFYAAIDLFALPSRCDSFGLVLLEAWANRVPCVAYRAGGPGEIIHHEEDGLLAECSNIPELAHCLDYLIENPRTRRQFGETGFKRLDCEFQWGPKLDLVRDVLTTGVRQERRNLSRPSVRRFAVSHRIG